MVIRALRYPQPPAVPVVVVFLLRVMFAVLVLVVRRRRRRRRPSQPERDKYRLEHLVPRERREEAHGPSRDGQYRRDRPGEHLRGVHEEAVPPQGDDEIDVGQIRGDLSLPPFTPTSSSSSSSVVRAAVV